MATSEDLFKCRVRFEGSNVIEGMRELGEAGIAEVPMPKHMRGLSNLGQNFIVLRDRKPLQQSQTSNITWPFSLLYTEELFEYMFPFLRQSPRTSRIWRTKKETCFIVVFSFVSNPANDSVMYLNRLKLLTQVITLAVILYRSYVPCLDMGSSTKKWEISRNQIDFG